MSIEYGCLMQKMFFLQYLWSFLSYILHLFHNCWTHSKASRNWKMADFVNTSIGDREGQVMRLRQYYSIFLQMKSCLQDILIMTTHVSPFELSIDHDLFIDDLKCQTIKYPTIHKYIFCWMLAKLHIILHLYHLVFIERINKEWRLTDCALHRYNIASKHGNNDNEFTGQMTKKCTHLHNQP